MAKLLFLAMILASLMSAGPLSAFFTPLVAITATAADSSGNLYLAGQTTEGNLPVAPGSALSSFPGCQEVKLCWHGFLAKISPDGKLIFATYIGDYDNGETISSIAVDASRNIYVAGSAWAFAALGGAVPSHGFVEEISADGTGLLAHAMLFGAQPAAIAVGPSGDVFAVGQTLVVQTIAGQTTDEGLFSATAGAFQTTNRGGTDAFVVRYDPSLSKPVYATLLGSKTDDAAYGLTIDAQGEAYVTGSVGDMRSFPMTPGAVLQYSSAQDVFVVKLNAAGSGLIFSALFGPNYVSAGSAIALDSSGIYIAGVTSGPAIPIPKNAFLRTGTQFAAKLKPDGSSLLYETLLPGTANASPPTSLQIAVDNTGKLLILSSSDKLVPTTPDSFSPCTAIGPNRFMLQLDAAGTERDYGSYLPGGLAIRSDGEAWYSDSTGAVNSFNIHDPLPPGPRCIADALSFYQSDIAPGKVVSLIGPEIGPSQPAIAQLDASGEIGTSLGGVSVYFNGIAAPLLYSSEDQINAVVPFEIAGAQTSSVVILKDGAGLAGTDVRVSAAAPGFAATSEGCIAAVNPDGSINSAAHAAIPGSYVSVFGEGAGLMNAAVTGGVGNGQSQIAAHVSANLEESGVGFPGTGFPVDAPLTVLYAGDAPGMVEGVFQLNLGLPDSFVSGKQIMRISIGGVDQQYCVWIAPR